MIAVNGQAIKRKAAFRLEYAVGINISAPAERIWAILTNAADFPRWNSTIQRIEGQITPGATITLYATIAPQRAFKLQIDDFQPNRKLVWSDGNFIFRGVRTYTLTPQGNGATDFTMSELFTGALLPLIAGSLPDFAPEFEKYAADLKREAEKAS